MMAKPTNAITNYVSTWNSCYLLGAELSLPIYGTNIYFAGNDDTHHYCLCVVHSRTTVFYNNHQCRKKNADRIWL